jgi:flagellar protein FlaJ
MIEKFVEKFIQIAFRTFGNWVRRNRSKFEWMRDNLIRARIYVPLEIYVSSALLCSTLSFLIGTFLSFFLFHSNLLLSPLGGLVVSALTFLTFHLYLLAKISGRKRSIDAMMFHAVSYMLVLAKAGVSPHDIFEKIAENPIYGELSKEMKYLVREMKIFGRDLITALQNLSETTPSARLREFSEGVLVTDLSGGEFLQYLNTKAEQYTVENRQMQKEYLELLSLLAEVYVTGFVAGPLFLIVILVVMGMISGASLTPLYLIGYVLIPFLSTIFIVILDVVTPEVYK